MNKYCTNCGKELNLESDYCLNCGKIIRENRTIRHNEKKISNELIGILGMVSSIIGFYLSFIFALFIGDAYYEINNNLSNIYENLIIYKFCFSLGYVFLSLIPSVTGTVLSVISIKKEKNMYSIIGIISGMVSLVFCIGIIVYLIM